MPKFIALERGIMEKPENCDEKYYDLMTKCWKYDPKQRITFQEIIKKLLKLEKNEEFLKTFATKSFYHTQALQ